MRKFEIEAIPMLAPRRKYPGAFGANVELIIQRLIYGKVLHLYSGDSLIGDERVDIINNNATLNCDVIQFIKTDMRDWDWVILDPPYGIKSKQKLDGYGIKGALAPNVPARRAMKNYMQQHTNNVLWLDLCAPVITGFYRKKLWLVLPGGFHQVRILSWLKKEMNLLL